MEKRTRTPKPGRKVAITSIRLSNINKKFVEERSSTNGTNKTKVIEEALTLLRESEGK